MNNCESLKCSTEKEVQDMVATFKKFKLFGLKLLEASNFLKIDFNFPK